MTEAIDRYKWYVVRAISGQERSKQYVQVELERAAKQTMFQKY